MDLKKIDKEIYNCNLCNDMVEKFGTSKTVSKGTNNDIVILGEAPANNGWRKSGVAFYGINGKLLSSGVVLQKLLDELNLKIEDVYFLEAIKCYVKQRKNLNVCGKNCRDYLIRQLEIIKPKKKSNENKINYISVNFYEDEIDRYFGIINDVDELKRKIIYSLEETYIKG